MIAFEIIQRIVLGLLALKLLWNLIVPYMLVWELFSGDNEETESISVMPYFEIVFMCFAVLLAVIIPNGKWIFDAGKVSLIGFGAVGFTYLHFIIIGMLGGVLTSVFTKQRASKGKAGKTKIPSHREGKD